MAIRRVGLEATSALLFQEGGATLNVAFCSGSITVASTDTNVLSAEVAIGSLRPEVEWKNETFDSASNKLTITLGQVSAYNPPVTFNSNALALIKNGRALGACPISSIVSTTLALATLETIDWAFGDTVVFSNGTTASIVSVNDSAKTITVNSVPAGVTTATTVANGLSTAQLLDVKTYPDTTLSTGSSNTITLTVTIAGF